MTRGGFTLIEVLVVLLLVGLAAGLAGLALRAVTPEPDTHAALAAARVTAVREGRTVRVIVGADSVAFYPDGSSSGRTVLVDPWTGAPHAP